MTVAVIDPDLHKVNENFIKRSETDYKIEWYSGTGKGGQNRNKVKCTCRMTHIPTGIKKTIGSRSRENNKQECLRQINLQLDKLISDELELKNKLHLQSQIGNGDRNCKRRTYRFRDDLAEDHITNKSITCSKILKGNFDLLWN